MMRRRTEKLHCWDSTRCCSFFFLSSLGSLARVYDHECSQQAAVSCCGNMRELIEHFKHTQWRVLTQFQLQFFAVCELRIYHSPHNNSNSISACIDNESERWGNEITAATSQFVIGLHHLDRIDDSSTHDTFFNIHKKEKNSWFPILDQTDTLDIHLTASDDRCVRMWNKKRMKWVAGEKQKSAVKRNCQNLF